MRCSNLWDGSSSAKGEDGSYGTWPGIRPKLRAHIESHHMNDLMGELQLYIHRASGIVILGYEADPGYYTGVAVKIPHPWEEMYRLGQGRTDWQNFEELCGPGCIERNCNSCTLMPPATVIEEAKKSLT